MDNYGLFLCSLKLSLSTLHNGRGAELQLEGDVLDNVDSNVEDVRNLSVGMSLGSSHLGNLHPSAGIDLNQAKSLSLTTRSVVFMA